MTHFLKLKKRGTSFVMLVLVRSCLPSFPSCKPMQPLQCFQMRFDGFKFYEEIRKTNPKLYNSPKVQLEMHKQAMENPNFFN